MSDDGLRAALVAIKAKLQARSDEGEAHLFLNIPYWELEELLAEYPPHLTDDGAAAPRSRGAVNTPAAESATPTAAPSSPHRPTCGTTYGESCDGYCPTPAIDRARIAVLALVSNLRSDAENHGTDVRHPRLVLENRANDAYRIVALLDGAQ